MRRWAVVVLLFAVSALAEQRSETILIVAVHHAPGQFRSDTFSPAHVRAALEAFDPQVVGVESNPEWFAAGRFYRATYEAQHVAVPWAKERKLPLYGIDWTGGLRDYAWERHGEAVRAARAAAAASTLAAARYEYGLASWSQLAPADGEELVFERLNSQATADHWTRWQDEGKSQAGSPQAYMETRNGHIVDHITAVADKHRGARIAVVIGAAHKGDLERRLRARGFTVVAPRLSVKDADALLTEQDIVSILAEAWDSTARSGVSRERSLRLLDRLRTIAPESAFTTYFDARAKMLAGDAATAQTGFAKIASQQRADRFPYSGTRWRHYLTVQQAARLELGRLADVAGRREEALAHYRAVLGSLRLPEYSEDPHSDYLYETTAHNAVRALTQTPYSPAPRTAPVIEEAAVTNSSEAARIQQAMELSRSGNWTASAALLEEVLAAKLAPRQRCEALVLAASAYARSRKAADAQKHLASFDRDCADLPKDHWAARERLRLP